MLSVAAHKETHSQQVREHRSAVLDFTQDYLKSTSALSLTGMPRG